MSSVKFSRYFVFVLFVGWLFGLTMIEVFSIAAKPPATMHSGNERAQSTTQAQAIIDGWSREGMNLPDSADVELFQSNIDSLTPLLAKAIVDKNPDVRMRAAYVMERCSPPNATLANLLVDRVASDGDQLVRIYVYDALCVHGTKSPEAVTALRKRWDGLDKDAIVAKNIVGYSEAAEAIYIAGTLSVCETDPATKQVFISYIFKWLAPPPTNLPLDDAAAYWDMQWSALAALRSMPPTPGSVPLLNALLQEKDAPSWVEFQTKSTLASQRRIPTTIPDERQF